MLTFINPSKEDVLIQFIVNLLYLGKISENCHWAESYGTERKVVDLLEDHLDLVEKANIILKNGCLAIKNNRFTQSTRVFKECEGYGDLINIFKNNPSDGDFSSDCRRLLNKVSAEFETYPEIR